MTAEYDDQPRWREGVPGHRLPWHKTPGFHAFSAAAAIVALLFLLGAVLLGEVAWWWLVMPLVLAGLPWLVRLLRSS